jgi:hypothetical protein
MAFTEVNAPRQIRFENPGDRVDGILLAMTTPTIRGKKTVQYMVEQKNGDRVTFLATMDLAQKLTRKMIGYPIFVEYIGLHDSIEKGGNRAKMFKVMVDWEAKPVASHLDAASEISDEDVPF